VGKESKCKSDEKADSEFNEEQTKDVEPLSMLP
jgi:hypothetical protein